MKNSQVKFLTVVWGDRYIQDFSRVALPSFLAAGNLPFLAQETSLEVLIMTSKNSVKAFDQESAFKALQSLCPVRFVFIDDLITSGNYGVTLTLAYARGISQSGAEQLDSYFVFMNSDFVLANGSLRTLLTKMSEGHPCILAPSLRACSETVLPVLAKSVDHNTTSLTMAPRQMVQLALENLHPTVIGKTITQDIVSCATNNQIYWQVNSTTLLGRYHLIFMLAIRPERAMQRVSSYCDYGFFPELVPSGRFELLGDSDDFFMLELQPSDQEKHFLRCGTASIRTMARGLSQWTTLEHRRFAEVDVVFHSRDLPSELQAVRDTASAFISRLHGMMATPLSHVNHYYWYWGVQSWLTLRDLDGGGMAHLPPELASTAEGPSEVDRSIELGISAFSRAYLRTLKYLRHWYFALGGKGNVPIWRHNWLDCRLLSNWITLLNERGIRRNLLVCSPGSKLPRSLQKVARFDVVDLRSMIDSEWVGRFAEHNNGERYGSVLCHVSRANVRETRRILEGLPQLLEDDGVVAVYIDHEGGESEASNFTSELAQYIHEVLPKGWTGLRIRTHFAGGLAKRHLRLVERRLLGCLRPVTAKRVLLLPLVASMYPVVAGLTALNNWRLRNTSDSTPEFCSSVLLSFNRSAELIPGDPSFR